MIFIRTTTTLLMLIIVFSHASQSLAKDQEGATYNSKQESERTIERLPQLNFKSFEDETGDLVSYCFPSMPPLCLVLECRPDPDGMLPGAQTCTPL